MVSGEIPEPATRRLHETPRPLTAYQTSKLREIESLERAKLSGFPNPLWNKYGWDEDREDRKVKLKDELLSSLLAERGYTEEETLP